MVIELMEEMTVSAGRAWDADGKPAPWAEISAAIYLVNNRYYTVTYKTMIGTGSVSNETVSGKDYLPIVPLAMVVKSCRETLAAAIIPYKKYEREE